MDRILDLLSPSLRAKNPKVDHYIDRESEEVVSKLNNLTEKVVFTLEDFYSVLQDAFKKRRIESSGMQD